MFPRGAVLVNSVIELLLHNRRTRAHLLGCQTTPETQTILQRLELRLLRGLSLLT